MGTAGRAGSATQSMAAPRPVRATPARATGPQPTARRTTGPSDWLLTAPHAAHRLDGRRSSAWGPFHIRRNGEQRTACGQSTLMWHTFWELKLDVLLARVCPDCAAATRGATQPARH